jgi:hypothetical protein
MIHTEIIWGLLILLGHWNEGSYDVLDRSFALWWLPLGYKFGIEHARFHIFDNSATALGKT